MSEEEVYQIEEWIEETKIMKFQILRKENENEKDFCKHWQILNKLNKGKTKDLYQVIIGNIAKKLCQFLTVRADQAVLGSTILLSYF